MKRWNWLTGLLLTMIGVLFSTNSAYAQLVYQHAWFSVDGGSEVSSKISSEVNNVSDYTLRGVAGQADAGELKQEIYTLTGGVLAVSTAPFAPPPETPPDTPPDETPVAKLFMPKLNR